MSYKTGFYEGRLGIGLGSTMGMGDGNPRYPLDINGDIRLTGSIVNGDGQVLSLVPAESLWTIGNSNLSYTGGNVGIGTTSPDSILHLKSTGDVVLRLEADTDNSGENDNPMIFMSQDGTIAQNNQYFKIGMNGDAGAAFTGALGNGAYLSSNDYLQFAIDGVAVMTMKYQNKYVGIGTTSPDHKLHIDGGNTGSTTFNDVVLKLSGTSTNNNGSVGMLFNMREGASGAKSAIFSKDYAGTWNRSSLVFCTNNDTNSNDATLSDAKMVIRETGNVGIGTTSPETLLTVGNHAFTNGTRDLLRFPSYRHNEAFTIRNNDDVSHGRLEFFWGNSQNGNGGHDNTIDKSILTLRSDGNVGIGTTSPQGQLSLYQSGDSGGELWFGNSNINGSPSKNYGQISFNTYLGGGVPYRNIAHIRCVPYGSNYGGDIIFNTNNDIYGGDDRMVIRGNGNVGIGTTSPDNLLHVNGSAQVDGRVLANYLRTSDDAYQSPGSVYGSRYYHSSRASQWIDNYNTGYWCESGSIMIKNGNLLIASDERIKEKITDVPDNLSLQMVRNIPTRYYEYKDKTIQGEGKTIGFIAQQVNSIFPLAVKKTVTFIPNEMRDLNDISWEEIIDGSNNKYKLLTDLQDTSGVKYRFYVFNDLSENKQERKEIIGDSDNTFTFDQSWNNVFCYGKEVDDFHTLDKQKLFALNFSATQELDRKVIALESENAELKTEVATLKSELAAIKQHLGI